ncbi:MAG TPA: BrnT family toxin, partial [Terriglobales bacterium]
MRFEWDEEKNRRNKLKHGISFQAAAVVFDDPF